MHDGMSYLAENLLSKPEETVVREKLPKKPWEEPRIFGTSTNGYSDIQYKYSWASGYSVDWYTDMRLWNQVWSGVSLKQRRV